MRCSLVPALAASLAFAGCASPMKRAVEAGDAGQVTALLDRGADLNGVYGQGELTPLKLAVRAGRPDVARLLLDRGADVNVRHNGTSALSLAAVRGDLPMVDLLLARGAEVGPREIEWAHGPDRDTILAHLKEAQAKQAASSAASSTTATAAAVPAAASDVDAPDYHVGEHPDDFALVVGVETYMDAPAARFAERDAEAVRRHLVALGWPERNVIVLTGKSAGRAGLEKYVERWLPNNVNDNARLVFYFAGNGASDPAGRPALLPWDGDPAQLEATGYPLSRLYQKLGALKTRSTLAILDAGFSGTGERSVAAPDSKPAEKLDASARDLGGVVALLAASAGEGAGTLEERKHGALTYYFLQDLNAPSSGPGGSVTLKRLFEDARAKIMRTAADAGRKQTPRLMTGSLGEGDLRLR